MADVTPDYSYPLMPFLQQDSSTGAGNVPGNTPAYADHLQRQFGAQPSWPSSQSMAVAQSPYFSEGSDQINRAFIQRQLDQLHRRGIGPGDLTPEESADRFDRLRGAASIYGMAGGLPSAAGITAANFSLDHANDPDWQTHAINEAVPLAASALAGPALGAGIKYAPKATAAALGALALTNETPQAGAGEEDASRSDERQKAIDRLWQDAQPRTIPPDVAKQIDDLMNQAKESPSRKQATSLRQQATDIRNNWQQQENQRQSDAKVKADTAANTFAGTKDAQAKAIEDEKLTFAHQHPVMNDILNGAGYAVSAGLPIARRGFAARSAANLESRANNLADQWDQYQQTINSPRFAKSTVATARKNAANTARELASTEPRIEDQLKVANPIEGFDWGKAGTYPKLLPHPVESGLGGLAFYESRALPHQIDYATLPSGNTQRDEAARWTPFSGNYDPRLLASNMAMGAGMNMFGRDIPFPTGGASLPRIDTILKQPQYKRSAWNKGR